MVNDTLCSIFHLRLEIAYRLKLISLHENKKKGKSPLEGIKGIKANVTMDDILAAIRENRER